MKKGNRDRQDEQNPAVNQPLQLLSSLLIIWMVDGVGLYHFRSLWRWCGSCPHAPAHMTLVDVVYSLLHTVHHFNAAIQVPVLCSQRLNFWWAEGQVGGKPGAGLDLDLVKMKIDIG